MKSLAYKLMKRKIERAIKDGTLEGDKPHFRDMLDAYLSADRITPEEYRELMQMIGGADDE